LLQTIEGASSKLARTRCEKFDVESDPATELGYRATWPNRSAAWEVNAMGNAKRRRRMQRTGLTDTQHEVLCFGLALMGWGAAFESEAAERAAWHVYRAELLAEHHRPGSRPFGYYKHELNLQGIYWWHQEVDALLRNNLIDQTEALAIEKIHGILAGDQKEGVCGMFGDAERIRELGLGRVVLERNAAQFSLAEAWHRWRGRKELAEKYRMLAAVTRSVVAESAAGQTA
jgi:hypothetical protein